MEKKEIVLTVASELYRHTHGKDTLKRPEQLEKEFIEYVRVVEKAYEEIKG